MHPVSRRNPRPFSHLCRPILSLLTAQKLTRLRPISHRTRPFSHFWPRIVLYSKANLVPESESEHLRTLEGAIPLPNPLWICGSFENPPPDIAHHNGHEPHKRLATLKFPRPPFAQPRSLRRTFQQTIGKCRLQQRFLEARSSTDLKLKSETSAIPAGSLLGEASKRVFWRGLTSLRWMAKGPSFPPHCTPDATIPIPRYPHSSEDPAGSETLQTEIQHTDHFGRRTKSSHFSNCPRCRVRSTEPPVGAWARQSCKRARMQMHVCSNMQDYNCANRQLSKIANPPICNNANLQEPF